MTASKVKASDLFGIFYVQKPGWKRWDSYYKTIDALRRARSLECQSILLINHSVVLGHILFTPTAAQGFWAQKRQNNFTEFDERS